MTIASTIAAIKALPNMTARRVLNVGEYRVTFTDVTPNRAEELAYYTSDPDDALHTARAMLDNRALYEECK
jgi:hypothetical protein